ncbi:MAG: NAD(+)/NADH kinase [Sandaracinaceae bacterium]|jgi:NAD+ kinase|nr:NAD(+)/NADH kinase [Sandaracinaceae bacterium]MBP7684371.1 NAD(+)/NADH kinase [Deltaproteobacteria bacterium]MBK6809661.1 NAD(+)/NADH kinase [Sandaracinaceae bacterium]MBK7156630.1 NAD(+)/NADH kinase [Sandaracinaceae bacterium]MBK7778443.1 NAD(+)/NADH kinase [Sandaracinaceae bacterium]
MSAPRVLVIYKRTTFQRFRGGKSTRIQALLDQGHRSVASLLEAHEAHLATLERTKEVLKHLGVDARFRHSYTPEPDDAWDLVVTLGGDGTLLWASHLVGPETPMLAINSAPRTSVGYFCAGDSGQVGELIEAALAGDMRATKLSRMQVSVDGELVHTRVLNDVLFCHECPAATTRYLLKRGDLEESQMSSGLWAGPAAGSTAAVRSAGGRVLPIGSQKLQFVVREPYHRGDARLQLQKGVLAADEELTLVSLIREGQLYFDGANRVQAVDIGSEVTFSRSPETLHLLGLRGTRRPPSTEDDPGTSG